MIAMVPHSRLWWLGRLIVVSVALSFIVGKAWSQATDGMLPDPISADRIRQYGDALQLSPQQRQAMESLHADHRAEFQALRDGPIEQWVSYGRDKNWSRPLRVKQRNLMDQIAAIDGRMFDRLAEALTPGQSAMLPRIKARRERERIKCRDDVWWWQDAPPTDLSECVAKLTLSAEQLAAVDAVLAEYEPALTALFRKKFDWEHDRSMKVYAELARQGFTDSQVEDLANVEAVFPVSKPLWDAEAHERVRVVKDIVALNRRTLDALRTVLPQDQAWRLQARYFAVAYPDLVNLVLEQSPFDEALGRKDLTNAQLEELRRQTEEFHREHQSMLAGAAGMIDGFREKSAESGRSREQVSDDRMAQQDALQKLWQVRATQYRAADNKCKSIVGVVVIPEPELDPESIDVSDPREVWKALDISQEMVGMAPKSITDADLGLYARWLGLNADQQRCMGEVHARHREAREQYLAGPLAAVRDAWAALHAGGAERNRKGFTIENALRVAEAQKGAATAMVALDDAFFNDLQLSCGFQADDAELHRVRLARERQRLNLGIHGGLNGPVGPGGSNEPLIDLSTLIMRVRGLEDHVAALRRDLSQYEIDLLALSRTRFERTRDYEAMDWRIQAEWEERRANAAPGEEVQYASNLDDRLMSIRVQLIALNKQIGELNRRTFERLQSDLPDDQARRLRNAYERLAWPRIFSDPSSARPMIDRALQLPDLSDSQRTQVEAVAAEYQPAYDDFRRRMIESVEPSDSPIYRDGVRTPDEYAAYMERRERRVRMAFDRHELNARSWHRLRGLLTPEQAKATGVDRNPADLDPDYLDFGA